jgi:hypothetical protein
MPQPHRPEAERAQGGVAWTLWGAFFPTESALPPPTRNKEESTMARRALLAAMTLLTLGVAAFETAAPASAGTLYYGNGAKVECAETANHTSTWVWTIPNVPTHTYTFKNFACLV